MVSPRPQGLIHLTVGPGVRVVRLADGDLIGGLYGEDSGRDLFDDLHAAALAELKAGETLVMNLGLLERFNTDFYTMLLRVRRVILARGARLILCRLDGQVHQVIRLFRGDRLFHVAASEAEALRLAGVVPSW